MLHVTKKGIKLCIMNCFQQYLCLGGYLNSTSVTSSPARQSLIQKFLASVLQKIACPVIEVSRFTAERKDD